MSDASKLQVVTANDLFDGDVVYFTKTYDWSRHLAEAARADDTETAKALLASANQQQHRVVGPYLAEVTIDQDDRLTPIHFREAFRTRGPSNYFHGKQAEA